MTLTNNSREQVAGAVSLFLGLTVAAAFKVGFLSPAEVPVPVQGSTASKPAPVRVRARVEAAAPLLKATAAPAASLAPRPPKTPPPVREVAVFSQAAPAVRTPPAAPPLMEVAPSIALEQPAHVVRPETSVPDVQPMQPLQVPAVPEAQAGPVGSPGNVGAVTGRPDAPPDDYVPPSTTFVEQPGGEVLVLGLLLDSKGHALDLKILVPSYDTVSDTKYAMAVLNTQSFTGINPPIPPGESRWIETRVYYPKQTVVPNVLP